MSWDPDVKQAAYPFAVKYATAGLVAASVAYYGRDVRLRGSAVVITVVAVQMLITLVDAVNTFSASQTENKVSKFTNHMKAYTWHTLRTLLEEAVCLVGMMVLIRVMFNQPTPQISRKN